MFRARVSPAVFVTHDQTEAMSLSDMVVIMDGGRIIQSDPPEQIYTAPSTPFVGNFVGRSNWLDASLLIRPEHVTLEPSAGAHRLSVQVAGVSFLGTPTFSPSRTTRSSGPCMWIEKSTSASV